MNKDKLQEKNILDPSEKVLKMYEAVTAFLGEGRDMNTVKVSDITSHAGIGKGTAYEYFSSKEEIIVSAMVWGCKRQIRQLTEEIAVKTGFQGKCFYLFDWLKQHKEYHHMLLKVIKENGGRVGGCELPPSPDTFEQLMGEHIHEIIDGLMEQGYQEGIFKEADVDKRGLAFLGAMLQYVFVVMGLGECRFKSLSDEALKNFVYTSMVKALN